MKFQASAFNFIEKETLAQLFSCDFCKISKSTFLTKHLRTTASVLVLPSYFAENQSTVSFLNQTAVLSNICLP